MKWIRAIGVLLLPFALLLGSISCARDMSPPTISDIRASDITETSVVITWETNEAATSQVQYGTSTGYGLWSQVTDALARDQSITLEDLDPGTIYHFRVRCKDSSGNEAASDDQTFVTTRATPTPGKWTALAEFGKIEFNVNEDGTGITSVRLEPFDSFSCEGKHLIWVSYEMTLVTPWPIDSGHFMLEVTPTAERYSTESWTFIIEGEFDGSGKHASGTLESRIGAAVCSGNWESL
ncbi:MAG: fibronectin type III domain-containing protein [Chloroflexi bacterium]|nr:fibronectin type III domain-containing protein [Chloroflexota bacterium]